MSSGAISPSVASMGTLENGQAQGDHWLEASWLVANRLRHRLVAGKLGLVAGRPRCRQEISRLVASRPRIRQEASELVGG